MNYLIDHTLTSITVEYLAIFRDITGRKSEEVSMDHGANIGDLVQTLIERNGLRFKEILMDPKNNNVNSEVIIILNEDVLKLPADLKKALKDGDEVSIGIAAFGG